MSVELSQESSAADQTYRVPDLSKFVEASTTIKKLVDVMDEQEQCVLNSRHLRYTEIDVEAERKAGRLAPDELYIPQHTIDTNIRREQALYVSYITGSPRSVVLYNRTDPTMDSAIVEKDFTNRVRYEGWQTPIFRLVDGMQQNGYGVVELVHDQTKPGHMALQDVAYGDFGYSLDSRDLQSCEMVVRRYYFTKTQLLALAREDSWKFNLAEVRKVVAYKDSATNDYKEQSLYKVEKVMFRKGGWVMIAWSNALRCNDWLRAPRRLYIGRQSLDPITGKYKAEFETLYPYFLFPYNITENTTIRQLKGRSYLDQDFQEAVSSLMSSFVTAHRRASYLVFSKDSENDPNADVITQSNINFKPGAVINAKVKQFQLTPPDPGMLGSIQALSTANSQENSQVNYAAQNRQDSRKTAEEIKASQATAQQLSQIQIALFSIAVKAVYWTWWEVLRSRVLAGLIKASQPLMDLYTYEYSLKPSGDTDVVERQQKIQSMMTAWPVISNTGAAQVFLAKLISLLFPDDAPQYLAAIQADNQKSQALGAALQVLTALVQDPNALGPQEKQNLPQLQQLIQQITSILNPQAAKQLAKQNTQQPKQITQGQQ